LARASTSGSSKARHSAQVVAHAQDVDHLAAGHALGPGRLGQLHDQLGANRPVGMGIGVGDDLEGGGLQGVAG
jgi:hypothetical protein